MSIKNKIYTTPELVTMVGANNLQGVVDYLNNKNIVKTNASLQTIWSFGDKYGDVAMGSLLTVLKTVAASDVRIEAALLAYQTRGLDLANDKIQTQIDQIIAAVPEATEVLTLLKNEGKWYVSWADENNGGDVLLSEVQGAVAERAKDILEGWLYSQYENLSAAIREGTVTTQQELISMFGT